jgi:hypothetical protein
MDERALLRNLVDLPVFDFHTVLSEYQLAAPGFLVVERLMVRLPIADVAAARLVPLLCGIVSMFLMRSVARAFLMRRAVPIAVGLFALNDWLLYYSSEIKQYTSDVLLTLIALLLIAVPTGMSRRSQIALVAFGTIGVWFSHPLALVLAGIGTYVMVQALLRQERKRFLGGLAASALWATSFAICYFISHRMLDKGRFIWDWWDFAFLPLPPRSIVEFERVFWQFVNIFNNPAWILTPLGVLASAYIALGLFSLGTLVLALKWRGGAYLLLSPLMFTMIASGLHQYPFHGRLLLFLVPVIHLLVAEGAAALTHRGGVVFSVALGLFLLFQPANEIFWHRAIATRNRGAYDSHGDLAPDLLDYFEQREIKPNHPRSGP